MTYDAVRSALTPDRPVEVNGLDGIPTHRDLWRIRPVRKMRRFIAGATAFLLAGSIANLASSSVAAIVPIVGQGFTVTPGTSPSS